MRVNLAIFAITSTKRQMQTSVADIDPARMRGKRCAVVGLGLATDGILTQKLTTMGADVRRIIMTDGEATAHGASGACLVDAFNPDDIAAAIGGADVIFSTASLLDFRPGAAERVWALNVGGMASLVLAIEIAGAKRLIHCGSILSLGHQATEAPVDTGTAYQSDDRRTTVERSLFRQEMEAWQAAERGLDVTTVCAGWILGSETAGRGGILDERLREYVAGGGRYTPPMESAFVKAETLASALIGALADGRKGERLMCAGENTTLAAVAEEMAQDMGLKGWMTALTPRQTRLLLKMPARLASHWLFDPHMGHLLTQKERYRTE